MSGSVNPSVQREQTAFEIIAPHGPASAATREDAAARLGVNGKTLHAWADRGFIPHIRTPTKYRLFEPAALDEFMAKMRIEPTGKLAA
jgi:excisionase family DNA binding protein